MKRRGAKNTLQKVNKIRKALLTTREEKAAPETRTSTKENARLWNLGLRRP